jgi:hypothetical protein
MLYQYDSEILSATRRDKEKIISLVGSIVLDWQAQNVSGPPSCEHFDVEQFDKFTIFRAKKKNSTQSGPQVSARATEYALPQDCRIYVPTRNSAPSRRHEPNPRQKNQSMGRLSSARVYSIGPG